LVDFALHVPIDDFGRVVRIVADEISEGVVEITIELMTTI
jgi:hypothetical protein